MNDPADSPFSSQEFKSNPYPYYASLRTRAPVSTTQLLDGTTVYVISPYEEVLAALKDARLIKDITNARPQADGGMMQLVNNASMLKADPPQHTRLRTLAHEAFTPKFVNRLRGRIQEIANTLIHAVQDHGRMDVIEDYAFPLPITVICEMLGVPTSDAPQFRVWTSEMIATGSLSSETIAMSPPALQLIQYLQGLITERRVAASTDLISALMHATPQGDHLSEVELLGTTLLFLVAGHETTVNLIGNGTLALLQDRAQWEELQRHPSRIKGAIEELLRFVNPVQAVNRYAAEDLVIAGVPVPQGSHLLLLLGAANHDEALAMHPEKLDVTRAAPRHVAFGQGIHYCLGAPLARLEGEIALSTLIRRLPTLELQVDPQSVSWRPVFELRGLQSLPVTF